MTRSGIGYDLHRLAAGRKLMIGGIEVPFDKGSVGHSDGDVLAHALCDALLGAASLGDIGTHFPDTDPKWKGAASLLFLEHTRKLLDERQLRISHLDAVVICERPKLGPHFPAMRAALAKSLGIAEEQINLKAKTNEGTGEIGRGEAIAAHTIARWTVELAAETNGDGDELAYGISCGGGGAGGGAGARPHRDRARASRRARRGCGAAGEGQECAGAF